jgi:hypothetical protein
MFPNKLDIVLAVGDQRPVHFAYQPSASSTFLSEEISHQQSAGSIFLSEQTITIHQPNEQAAGPARPGRSPLSAGRRRQSPYVVVVPGLAAAARPLLCLAELRTRRTTLLPWPMVATTD